jgi:hypothetical protein
MKSKTIFILFPFSLIICLLVACNNATTSENSDKSIGKIIVNVQDNDSAHTPVPNAQIFINSLNQSKFTDSTGTCVFELKPNLYIIEAYLCCVGPGTIDYHDSVLVIENETKYLTFTACLSCE